MTVRRATLLAVLATSLWTRPALGVDPPSSGRVCSADAHRLANLAFEKTSNGTSNVFAIAALTSSGLLPSVLALPVNSDYGKYDQCRYVGRAAGHVLPFGIQYCSTELAIGGAPSFRVTLGLCLPASCTPGAIEAIVRGSNSTEAFAAALSLHWRSGSTVPPPIALVSSPLCGDQSVGLPPGGMVIVTILVIAGALSVVGAIMGDSTPRGGQGPGEAVGAGEAPVTGYKAPLLPPPRPLSPVIEDCDSAREDEAANESGVADAGVGDDAQRPPPRRPCRRCGFAVLRAFSLRRNYRELVAQPGPRYLRVLDGVRVLSICWVVVGHAYALLVSYFPLENLFTLLPPSPGTATRFASMFVPAGHFAVDSFFLLGGLLLVYIGGRRMTSWAMVPRAIGLRWLRLTPLLVTVLVFQWQVLPSMGNGPLWSFVSRMPYYCPSGWWKELIYINNLDPWMDNEAHACMIHAWYLGCEFQLFAIGCVLLVLGHLHRRAALIVLALLGVGSVAVRFGLTAVYGYHENQLWALSHRPGNHSLANDLTYRPYAHGSPYFIGMGLGFLLRTDGFKATASAHWLVGALVPVSIAVIGALVYGLLPLYRNPVNAPHDAWSPALNLVYVAVKDAAFAAALAVLVLACAAKHRMAAPIHAVLAWPAFHVAAKLVFGVYLVHPYVLLLIYGSQQQAIVYTDVFLAATFTATLVLSFGAAAALFVCVEMPFANLVEDALRSWRGARK